MRAGMKAYFIGIILGALVQGCGGEQQTTVQPKPPELAPVTYSENALTPADRQQFYHLHEGSELFPVAWILHMDSPKTNRPFIENLERFGLIPDPDGPFFEGTQTRMPVGIAVAERAGLDAFKPLGLNTMVGVNCSACHVGQLEYGGKRLRIDGAPNLFDIVGFLQEIKDTATTTYTNPRKLWSYLKARIKAGKANANAAALDIDDEVEALNQGSAENKAVAENLEKIAGDSNVDEKDVAGIKSNSGHPEHVRLTFGDLAEEIRLMESYLTLLKNFSAVQHPETVPGFGRADAFNTARALLFGKENEMPLTGPSSFPFIWNMQRTAWFHWPSNTNSVLQRNIGEALGLGASADAKTGESTIDLYSLYTMEQLAYKTRPPKWPEDLLGKIDQQKADRGEQIYRGMGAYAETGNCARCHESGKPDPQNPSLTNYTLIPLNVIQTDDNEAKNWAVPVKVGGKTMDFGAAQKEVLDRVEQKGKEQLKKLRPDLDVDKIDWESGRTAKPAWRIAYANAQTKVLGYPAKPLIGIWATAPYLHNGSVPTLADMLTPPSERPQAFLVGSREYDPEKMGYRTDQAGFTYNTTWKGNSNQGHTFGTTLKPEEKEDLMEFLKRLTAGAN